MTIRLRFSLLLILCFIFALPAHARDGLIDIQEITSTNGLKAWLVEDHSVPVIALKFNFKNIGAKLDPAEKQGLARMVSNTMDEGAGALDSQAFQKELQDLSITLRFSAGRDNFGGELKTLTKNKARALELLKSALTQPRFDAGPVERMRKANQSRIRAALADPEWMAARILNDRVFEHHPYAQNSGGTITSLNNITREDLIAFHKLLAQDKLIIAAAGDITAQELSALLDDVFIGLPQTSRTESIENLEPQHQAETYLYKKDIPQTVITLRQKGIDRNDPAYHTAQVMNFILGSSGFGSRLTKEIREKRGLTYGVYSFFSDMEHADLMGVSTSTKNESTAELLDLIKAEWRKMKEHPVSEEELKAAQSYLIGSLPLSLTSTDQIASLLLSIQYDNLPLDYLDQRQTAIETVTPQDIQNLAKDLLTPENFITVLVGQPIGIENAIIIENLPNAE